MRNSKQIVRGAIDTRNHRPDQLVASPELCVGVGEGCNIIARDPRCVDQLVLNFSPGFCEDDQQTTHTVLLTRQVWTPDRQRI